MRENEIILLKSDLAFKMVFGRDNEQCKYSLKSLLETILNIEISTIEYKNPININEAIDYRQTEFDISVTIEGSINCDIEIQLKNHDSFNHRLVYYGATLLTSSLESKESYSKMKKAIVICLSDFVMFKEISAYRNNFIMKERNNNYSLSDVMEIVTLEMPKIDAEKQTKEMTNIEKWLMYIKYSGYEEYKEKLKEILSESEAIEMTERAFNEIKGNEQTRSALLSRQRFQYDINAQINDSYDKGLEKGKLEEKINIAMKLLKRNADMETIIELSELTEAEICQLKSKSDI